MFTVFVSVRQVVENVVTKADELFNERRVKERGVASHPRNQLCNRASFPDRFACVLACGVGLIKVGFQKDKDKDVGKLTVRF